MEDQNNPQPTSPESALPSAPVTNEPSKSHHVGFTPVTQLMKDAWHLMTKKLLKMIVLGLYLTVGSFGVIVTVVIIALVLMFAFNPAGGSMDMLLENPSAISSFVALFILYIIALSVLVTVQQVTLLRIVGESDEQTSVMILIKRSFPLIIPSFIVSVLVTILTVGSTFVFVIPGIIVSIFFSFVLYVLVFENKRGVPALKMSMGIVQQHFGAIVGRILAIVGIIFGLMIVMTILSEISDALAALMGLFQFILQLGMGVYMSSYIFLVYKQARAVYDESKPVSMTWVWIVSAIGWVLAFLFMMGMMSFAKNLPPNAFDSLLDAQMEEQKNADMMYDSSLEYDADGTGEMPEELNKMFDVEMQKQIEQMQKEAGNEI
ncbi:hypothetical protein KBD81_01020 [Candidatus Woesebacteria bacterium]|nr:hypothetical protein [Candidatus Woesebacteria bacterium]